MGKVGKCSYIFHNVFIASASSVVGPKEHNGPLGIYFDKFHNNLYADDLKLTYEKAEIKMINEAIEITKKKVNLIDDNISLVVGGDLNNQITATNYTLRDYNIPYIGCFAACSTITLDLILGANIIENSGGNILCVSSSHNGTAERQFRYPNEYGIQRSPTYTSTVTGASAIAITNEKTNIKITKATIGKVIDVKLKDVQDMGRAMAPAAYATIKQHLQDFNITIDDYELICTGDLSKYGSEMLKDMFLEDNIDISKVHNDAGLLIYNDERQDTLSGGSGCGCIGVVLSSYLLRQLKNKELKKILVCATGALMNPVMLAQKESIPAICHAITLEVLE